MAKMILYTLLVVGGAYSVPPVRDRVDGPVSRTWARMAPYFKGVTDPVRKSLAERELSAIVGRLREEHVEGRPLPDASAFQSWIRDRLDVGRDPWDNQYYLLVDDDGAVSVGSNGADGKRGTPDDVTTPCTW